MHCEIGGTQGPLGYVSALGATRLVHWLILVAPSCLRSHNARYIMLKSLNKPYLRILGSDPCDTPPQVQKVFHWTQHSLIHCTYLQKVWSQSILTVRSKSAQSNAICTYGKVSSGSLASGMNPKVPFTVFTHMQILPIFSPAWASTTRGSSRGSTG